MIHKIEKGDNLYRIGIKYGTTAEEIKKLNGFLNYDIYVGQVIKIPTATINAPQIVTTLNGLKPSDMCIVDSPIPLSVMDALIRFHYIPIKKIMKKTGLTVWASLKSGYRPRDYEIATGRGAGSQHTFEEVHEHGLGAVDWTTKPQYLDLLQASLISSTNYRRVTRYKTFIHCDFKDVDGSRRLYKSDENSNWTFLKTI